MLLAEFMDMNTDILDHILNKRLWYSTIDPHVVADQLLICNKTYIDIPYPKDNKRIRRSAVSFI